MPESLDNSFKIYTSFYCATTCRTYILLQLVAHVKQPYNISHFFNTPCTFCGIIKAKGGVVLRILIDADGCPVVDESVKVAKKHNIECLILCDTSHVFEKDGAKTFTYSKGADSVDFALVNMIIPKDIVVTQDYGLASMCLARNAIVLSQNGMQYTEFNIDSLLLARHTAKKIRSAGGRLRGAGKRTKEHDIAFEAKLNEIIVLG